MAYHSSCNYLKQFPTIVEKMFAELLSFYFFSLIFLYNLEEDLWENQGRQKSNSFSNIKITPKKKITGKCFAIKRRVFCFVSLSFRLSPDLTDLAKIVPITAYEKGWKLILDFVLLQKNIIIYCFCFLSYSYVYTIAKWNHIDKYNYFSEFLLFFFTHI